MIGYPSEQDGAILPARDYEPLSECVYKENTSDKWDIPLHTTRERFITISYHAIENTGRGQHNQCDKRVAHDGKVGWNAAENTTFSF